MEDITIETDIALPEVQEPDGAQAFVERVLQEYGIVAAPTGEKLNGNPVFTFTAPKEKLEAFIAKEFEGGDYSLEDFPPSEETPTDALSSEGDTEVVDTTDGVSPTEEDSMVKALEALDEETRSRILARFSKQQSQPETETKVTGGTALAKLMKGLKY